MSRSKRTAAWLTVVSGIILAAALALPAHAQTSATVYEGARLITGGGGTIENSAFVVENGRFTQVGRRGELQLPAGAGHVLHDEGGSARQVAAHVARQRLRVEAGAAAGRRAHQHRHLPPAVEIGDGVLRDARRCRRYHRN